MQITTTLKKIFVLTTFFLLLPEFTLGQKELNHEYFIEKIKDSNNNIYKECLQEYDTYLEKFPDDVSILIEKCKFIQYAQFDDYDYINPNQEAFDYWSSYVTNRFPDHPEVLLFQTSYLWDDDLKDVFQKALISIDKNPQNWNKENLANIYEQMANYYSNDGDYKQALNFIEKAISNNEQKKYSLDYVRILLELENKSKALSILNSIPDTTKEIWQLTQKANLLLELKEYSKASEIYNQVEKMDSTYINKADFASTLEGFGQFELARKYLINDTSNNYGKKEALLRLFNHDLKYQEKLNCLSSYNALRDLGYSSDPIGFYRLKLFFSHPTLAWKFRDLLGILSLIALLSILIIIPYIWILPIYFAGKQFKLLSPIHVYASHWSLKTFWFVSIGYLFASVFIYIIEPEELYSIFNNLQYSVFSQENSGYQFLIFIIIIALFGFMAMYKVPLKILLSSSYSIRKSILKGVGLFFIFKVISGIYVAISSLFFNVSLEDFSISSKIILATKEDMEALASVVSKSGAFLLAGFLVPVYEEIIFRGVILDSCQKHLNFNIANIIQSVLFAALHDSLFLFPLFFIFGIITGNLRKSSGGLLPGIVFHIINNVIAMLILFSR